MKNNVQKHVVVGIFSALAIILQLFSFPIIPEVSFLKLEFSCVIFLFLMVLYGIRSALISSFVVNIFDFFLHPGLLGYPLDQIINFTITSMFLLICYIFYKKNKNTIGLLVSTVITVTVSVMINYLFLTPLYFGLLGVPLPENFFWWCLSIYGSFNIIKWVSIVCIFSLLIRNKTLLHYFQNLKKA